jgi:hypothetical protein
MAPGWAYFTGFAFIAAGARRTRQRVRFMAAILSALELGLLRCWCGSPSSRQAPTPPNGRVRRFWVLTKPALWVVTVPLPFEVSKRAPARFGARKHRYRRTPRCSGRSQKRRAAEAQYRRALGCFSARRPGGVERAPSDSSTPTPLRGASWIRRDAARPRGVAVNQKSSGDVRASAELPVEDVERAQRHYRVTRLRINALPGRISVPSHVRFNRDLLPEKNASIQPAVHWIFAAELGAAYEELLARRPNRRSSEEKPGACVSSQVRRHRWKSLLLSLPGAGAV